jgi:DNA-binding transcriptional LysR family regulator
MPRLPGFYARHPGITVNVQAPPSDAPALSPGIDIALVYGRPDPGNARATRLFDERVCPVGAPALVARAVADGRALDTMPLIHVRSARHLHWAGWPDYLSARGLPRPRGAGTSFDNYVQAVQETLNGRGVMLGWRSITGDLVAEGVLAEWPDAGVDFGTAYSLVEATAPGESAAVFADWLRDAAAA